MKAIIQNKLKVVLQVIASCGAMLLIAGCYELYFKKVDMQNVRRQFHLNDSIEFLSFNSYPKTAGFFGREGLSIKATLGFTNELFEEYISQLDDTSIWKPVSYLNYSPDIGDEYSTEALHWKDLPLPDSIKNRFNKAGFKPEGLDTQNGKYYCSVLLAVRGEPLENNPAAFRWYYVGKSFSELTASDYPTVLAYAVLDYEKRIMHVHINFSG